MIKTLKKVLLSSLSVLGISTLVWILFLLNPSWSYANKTEFDFVNVHHNLVLDEQTEAVINNAIGIIKKSPLFDEDVSIDLCLNDDEIYPQLNPLYGQCLAYATLNKTTLKNGTPKFKENIFETRWEINEFELRQFNLTYLLAHEFTHNLQNKADLGYMIKSTVGQIPMTINWKLEGHADYVAREFANDGILSDKIEEYLDLENVKFVGYPVFDLEDGTKQIYSYRKYSLVVQYLLEEKNLNFSQLCKLETTLDKSYNEMLEWHKNK